MRAASNHLNAGDDIEIHANVLNLGKVAGDDVVQLFLRAPQNEYTPLRALAGFQRIHLASGSSTEVTFRIDARTLSTVDESGLRRVVPGDYTFFLGSNDGWSKAADNTVTVSIDGSVALPK